MPTKEWVNTNRELINEKRRQRYMLNKQKDDWPDKREKMLQRKKNAKTMCPQCKILYGSVYLKHHIALRHRDQVLKSGMPVATQAAPPPQ
tara:strand:+ start:915 stop:1184 length:270 start_codon:yes stop_codon:yes gene_type:complete